MQGSLAILNTVLLDDGTELGGVGKVGMGLNNTLGLIRDWTVISQNFIEGQLGRQPEHTFFRGHSAGGAVDRSFLVVNGMNIVHEGEKLFDGFYLSDSAGGRGATAYFWEATVIDEHGSFRLQPSNNDALTFDNENMRFIAPTIEVIHAEYAGNNTATVPRIFERIPGTYTQYKRENARINIKSMRIRIGLQDSRMNGWSHWIVEAT